MQNFKQRQKNSLNEFLNNYFSVIVLIIIVIIFVCSYFFLIQPKINSLTAVIKGEIEQKYKLYINQKSKLLKLQALAEDYKKLNDKDLSKLDLILPNKYYKERLFGELEEMIGDSGFIVTDIKIIDEDDPKYKEQNQNNVGEDKDKVNIVVDPAIGVLDVQVDISNIDYRGLKGVLNMLEKNVRLFDVVNVSFDPEKELATLQMKTYYYKNN